MKQGLTLAIIMLATAPAGAQTRLDDAELDQITAGSAALDGEELLKFSARRTTRSGSTIDTDGSLTLVQSADQLTSGILQLSDNAQSQLQSLININAVNSPVNVLLNMNISIDSQIDRLSQSNNLTTSGNIALPRPGQ